jgi:hexosaminidase
MRKLLFLLAIVTTMAHAQPVQTITAPSLKIDWQPVTNHYLQPGRFLATITLTNTDAAAQLPKNGWRIFYNGFKDAVDTNMGHGLKSYRIHGDLFCLEPTAEFNGLKPSEKIELQFIGDGWVYNISDAPTGFYMVWDNAPTKAFNITNVTVHAPTDLSKLNRWPDGKPEQVTPQAIFEANKVITNLDASKLPKIFPTPVSTIAKEGSFTIGKATTIACNPLFEHEADYLVDELALFIGTRLKKEKSAQNVICLELDAAIADEGYRLLVNKTDITILASSPAGIFYGIQSLKCLLPLNAWAKPQPTLKIDALEVRDAPRFGYRGLHIDVARNFQTKEQLLRMLNWMAMYKLNKLHFHFSEDEAWRLEIKALPELTQVGAMRGHTLDSKTHLPASYGSGGATNNPQSGFYTRQDYIDIVRFANLNHIEVIPEIETPGHARAAIMAMNARRARLLSEGKTIEADEYLLVDPNDKSIHSSPQKFTDNVMCVALPSVYRFIETVVDELIAMHNEAGQPLTTIHAGGDEVPHGTWERSPLCQALLQQSTTDNLRQTADLWLYYWDKADSIFTAKGLYVSGWEEIGMRETRLDGRRTMMVNPELSNRNFHTYVWNTIVGWGADDLPYRLANGGYKVVLCPVTHLYFDLAYQNHFDEPGQYWGGFLDTDKPFSFIPYDFLKNVKTDMYDNPIDPQSMAGKMRLTDYGKTNIVGIQGQLWSENMHTADLLEYFAFPKMLALAERAWAADPVWAQTPDAAESERLYKHAWNTFVNVLGKRELVKLSHYQGGANFRIPTVGAVVENGAVWANIQLPGLTIRYTINGDEPTNQSTVYQKPITLKGIVKLRAFDDNGRGGRTITIINQ